MKLEQAEAQGFDLTTSDGAGHLTIKCSACEALVINGTPCHETGCRNQMHECEECMTLVPRGHRLCESCANPEPFYEGEDDEDQTTA